MAKDMNGFYEAVHADAVMVYGHQEYEICCGPHAGQWVARIRHADGVSQQAGGGSPSEAFDALSRQMSTDNAQRAATRRHALEIDHQAQMQRLEQEESARAQQLENSQALIRQ